MSQPLGVFQPIGVQASIAVTAVVQQLDLPAIPAGGGAMRVVVDGTANVAWTYGAVAGLTLNTGVHMLANTVEVFSIPGNVTQLSVIGAAAGSTLRVIVGDGQ